MSAPSYPERGKLPWDKELKTYIDYGDRHAAPGEQGPQGVPGPPGIPGGDTVQSEWTWEASPVQPPLDEGLVGVSDPPPREATQLILSCHAVDGNDYSNAILDLAPGDHIHLQVAADPTSWHTYEVTGPVIDLGANTYSVPVVTYTGSPPETAPAYALEVYVAFQFAPRPGPIGPPGPPGPAGGASYVHDQLEVSDTWVVTHSLSRYPSVTVVDSGNTVITPDVHYDSADQVTILFGSPTSGKAYLS